MTTLKLGCYDRGALADRAGFLGGYHLWKMTTRGFRGERNGVWHGFSEQPGTPVRRLQEKLRAMGFYPFGAIDGIYGYRTQSSVRLFQEFVTVSEEEDIGGADGKAGSRTRAKIDAWARAGRKAPWGGHSPEYTQAMTGLRQLREHFLSSRLKGIALLNRGAAGSCSRAVADWRFDDDDLHLIGIRRNENEVLPDTASLGIRRNDDLFVLLVNGKRLVFRGSTNPNPRASKRLDQPFILRGQHEFYFAWHKLGSLWENANTTRVYRAFKPCGNGPLIVRTQDSLLTERSFDSASPNNTINIHWSGAGTSNWSAGCQVVAGKKYIDYRNEVVDLGDRAATSYADLSGRRTRGAYNVLLDALTVFARDARHSGDRLLYTLLYERDVKRTAAGGLVDFDETVRRLS